MIDKIQIEKKMELLSDYWERNEVDIIYSTFYSPNTEISGEGSDIIYTGEEALKELLSSLVTTTDKAVISLNKLQKISDDSVVTWVTWDVKQFDGANFNMKSLFVWGKVNGDWKILADMYNSGSF